MKLIKTILAKQPKSYTAKPSGNCEFQSSILRSCIRSLAMCIVIGIGISVADAQVVRGQVDDFEDGTVQDWREGLGPSTSPNPPVNVASGGPDGVDDNYMSDLSTGGFGVGTRMTVNNTAQWSGDYLTKCINGIRADARVPGASANSLNLRFAIQGPGSTRFVSTNSVPVPIGGNWMNVRFPIEETDLTRVSGGSNYNQVMAAVNTARINSSAAASWQGDAISATVHLDNIQSRGTKINGDSDCDEKADILWREASTGQNWGYLMNGGMIGTTAAINTVANLNWEIVGRGDYNGDGNADILWWNSATGQVWMYLMSGLNVGPSISVVTVGNLNWRIVGNGDYDDDGNSDILWREIVSGQVWMYLMNGPIINTSAAVVTVGNLNWKIVGSGDYDGDGKSDILWHDISTGQVWMYLMDGTMIDTTSAVATVGNTNWKIVGNDDFDGNGTTDILWREMASGENWIYFMNGTMIDPTSGQVNVVGNLNWEVVDTGDYDGDGDADIFWRENAIGFNQIYLMDGKTVFSNTRFNSVGNLNWKVVNVN